MNLKAKIISLGVGAAIVPILVVSSITVMQKQKVEKALNEDLDVQIRMYLTSIAEDMYALCESQQEALLKTMNANVNVAEDAIRKKGGISFAIDSAQWSAVNQVTKDAKNIGLPMMMVGDTWLGQNADPAQPTPIVDDVVKLVGGTCTIFQRMNEGGDMLRVATNIVKDGKRAIGTFIPAVDASGVKNTVISTVLSGERFVGRAFVVDDFYITAYQPLKDASGKVVGMVYVGVKQENVASLRNAILTRKIGDTGYVFVLGGSGADKGKYYISQDGKRDGEMVLDAKDANGTYFIKKIVEDAVSSRERSITFQFYPWKAQGDKIAKQKVAAVVYFKPWDWVIGASATMEELDKIKVRPLAMMETLVTSSLVGGAIVLAIAIILAVLIGQGVARTLSRIIDNLSASSEQTAAAAAQISTTSQQLSQGATEQASSLEESSSSLDEMSSMTKQNADNAGKASQLAVQSKDQAEKGGEAMKDMQKAMGEIDEASDKVRKIIKTIEEIAFQTNLLALNAAVEAARAGDHGKGFAVVADEVRNLAQRAASASRETANLIADSVSKTKEGTEIVKKANEVLEEIMESSKKVSDIISEIAAASKEQAEGIGQVANAVSQMDQVTQQNAANAEESASASEELSSQAELLKGMIQDLQGVVGGAAGSTQNLAIAGGERRQGISHRKEVQGKDKRNAPKMISPDEVV